MFRPTAPPFRTIVILGCLFLLSGTAIAQYCPVCGTDPCRYSTKAGLRAKEPPPPSFKPLPPEANAALARIAVRLTKAAGQGLTDLGEELRYKMLRAKPTDLIYTIKTISESWKEYKDPATLDNLVKAVQVDAIMGIYKSVTTNGVGTVSHLGEVIHAAHTVNEAKEGVFDRVDQFFNLLDKTINESLGLHPRPQSRVYPNRREELYSPYVFALWQRSSVVAAAYQPQTQTVDVKEVRERLLFATLSSYYEAGMYDQLIEFHKLAIQQWGRVSDPGLESSINRFVSNARYYVGLGTKEDSFQATLEGGSSLIISFRTGRNSSIDEFAFGLNFYPKPPADWGSHKIPEGPFVMVGASRGRQAGYFSSGSNGLEVPTSLTATKAQQSWQTLKVDAKEQYLRFYLNGQFIGMINTTLKTVDSTGRVDGLARFTTFEVSGSTLIVPLQIIFRVSSRKITSN